MKTEAYFMKVKVWTILFVILAILCLFGCDSGERKPEDMVLHPSAVEGDDLTGEVMGHLENV